MPIPFPVPPPTRPVPGAPINRHWLAQTERYAEKQVLHSHSQALMELGEFALFTMIWHDNDYQAGLVGLCPICSSPNNKQGRISAAYAQPTRDRCPDCYGTRFAGGIRAQIVRPTLWTDSAEDENVQTPRGEIDRDTMRVETTGDFDFRPGDYIFRSTGDRYQGAGSNDSWIRTGLATPTEDTTIAGYLDRVSLEDASSVAYMMPPSKAELMTALRIPAGTHFSGIDWSGIEQINGPLKPS